MCREYLTGTKSSLHCCIFHDGSDAKSNSFSLCLEHLGIKRAKIETEILAEVMKPN